MPEQLELELTVERFTIDALVRALSVYPPMTSIHASYVGGHAGESFLDSWDDARDGPRPA
jgi:hypothetical protein